MTQLTAALVQNTWSGESAAGVVRLAEELLRSGEMRDRTEWHGYLEATGQADFLSALPGRPWRHRWAETAFQAVDVSRYTLAEMLSARVKRHPDRTLFMERPGAEPQSWSYARTARRLRTLAGLFLQTAPNRPRVAIYAENCVDSACCDLACLVHGIFVTPLNVHFDAGTLAWIFNRLAVNVVVTDSEERAARLEEVRPAATMPFRVFRTGSEHRPPSGMDDGLEEACTRLDLAAVDRVLAAHARHDQHSAITAMFTSGSTGAPKGVLFSIYNLVTKRFARAAALPGVGHDEALLCYLPLYHTFGRYLEMLGTLYWGGTYVFSANPSVETLLAELQQVQPTGLVSVPLRWSQVADAALERLRDSPDRACQESAFRTVVGQRLRWGLSAAGYLDPRVFRFFQRHGVDLCSGFGMTEGTGGITMTPPGEYVDQTVGLPLPGTRVRFSEKGELQIAGPYVTRYLPEAGGPDDLPRIDPSESYWLATGDLFRVHDNGYLEIVDRIKDIYKNSRGQTIAPRRVEQKFDDVPGVKRAFLVGDHRDYNVLLLVPNPEDPVFRASAEDVREYLRHVVRAANAGLAPYERVVNFTVLDRDFELERGELTPKGSYRRRAIEEHFRDVIDKLYESSHVELRSEDLTLRIPRWFCRDLGILETDIRLDSEGLTNIQTGERLALRRTSMSTVLLGSLEYEVSGPVIEIGLFARQPKLWIGNPGLLSFCPCKDGWDLPLGQVSGRLLLPRAQRSTVPDRLPAPSARDEHLKKLNALCTEALFAGDETALRAISQIGQELPKAGDRFAGVLRRRLEALARHSNEEVRCLAYRILLLDEPLPDYSRSFPAFIESGLTFLNENSIREIARSNLGQRQLAALRRRLFRYRLQLPWPASPATRDQFVRIFALLGDFAREHRDYYGTVRAELAAWSLHEVDPDLSRAALDSLMALSAWFEKTLRNAASSPGPGADNVVFEDGFSAGETAAVRAVLADETFLTASITAAFDDERWAVRNVAAGGIWVSRILSQHQLQLCRVSINMKDGRHFDLLLAMGQDLEASEVNKTFRWMMALSELPDGGAVLPKFGTYRADLGAFSLAYVSDLTVSERIREFAGAQVAREARPGVNDWRQVLVRGMEAFFRLWTLSGRRLLPGSIAPANVVVPATDFTETSLVLSLAGSRSYTGTLSLVRPLLRNFYRQTAAHYPKTWDNLRLSWICEACLEGLGPSEGESFLRELRADLAPVDKAPEERELAVVLESFLAGLVERPHLPLALACAVDRYADWERINPGATPEAREDQIEQLFELYRLGRYPSLVRYELFRRTYFAHAPAGTRQAFDSFLLEFGRRRARSPFQMEELSELQAALGDAVDRDVFSRMLLPRSHPPEPLEVLAIGEGGQKQVVVRTEIRDGHGARYQVREPVSASEVGHLFRLLFESGQLAPGIAEQDRFLLALDEGEEIVAGTRYRLDERGVAVLLELVVVNALKGRGIGSALLEDFCARMTALRATVVRTKFILRRFYTARGFRPDARWGGLVRFLA